MTSGQIEAGDKIWVYWVDQVRVLYCLTFCGVSSQREWRFAVVQLAYDGDAEPQMQLAPGPILCVSYPMFDGAKDGNVSLHASILRRPLHRTAASPLHNGI